MTWINSAELASIRARERIAHDDLEATRVALSKALESAATRPTLLGWQKQTPSDAWAHALMIIVTLFIVAVVAIQAGWL